LGKTKRPAEDSADESSNSSSSEESSSEESEIVKDTLKAPRKKAKPFKLNESFQKERREREVIIFLLLTNTGFTEAHTRVQGYWKAVGR
jgi:hypothetical protein